MYDYNLSINEARQTDKWTNFVVELPQLPGQEAATVRLATGATVKYSVPSTKQLREEKRLARETSLEVATEMLQLTGMKDWQMTEYLAGRRSSALETALVSFL